MKRISRNEEQRNGGEWAAMVYVNKINKMNYFFVSLKICHSYFYNLKLFFSKWPIRKNKATPTTANTASHHLAKPLAKTIIYLLHVRERSVQSMGLFVIYASPLNKRILLIMRLLRSALNDIKIDNWLADMFYGTKWKTDEHLITCSRMFLLFKIFFL